MPPVPVVGPQNAGLAPAPPLSTGVVPGGPGGFSLDESPPGGGSSSGGVSQSRVGWIRRTITLQGRKDRLRWAQAIDVAAEEENVDPVVLAVIVATVGGKVTAALIRQAAQALARAFYQHGTVKGALKALGITGARLPSGYQVNFGDPINDTIEGGGGAAGGGGGGGGGSSGGGRGGRGPRLTPEQSVQLSLYRSAYKEELENPWVKILPNGKVTFVSNTRRPGVPPKGTIGIRRDEFLGAWRDLTETFQAFIGRKPRAREVATILKRGWSSFKLKQWLSRQPGFEKSSIFRAAAPELIGVANDILGPSVWDAVNGKQRKELLRQAIVNGWSQSTFAERLRKLPAYLKGNEFKQAEASLSDVYAQIFGYPTSAAVTTIREAALSRWSPDQFAAFLRNSPSYSSSPEYQVKALSVLDALGMISGSVGPALVPGTPIPGPPREGFGQPPDSPRIPGSPSQPSSPLAGLTPTFA